LSEVLACSLATVQAAAAAAVTAMKNRCLRIRGSTRCAKHAYPEILRAGRIVAQVAQIATLFGPSAMEGKS
jgi:hypothetical protein